MGSTASSSETEWGRSLLFRAGGRVYTCAVDMVREIVPVEHLTRLPGAPSFVPGLINVRGAIVTVIDAGLYLHGRSGRPPGTIILVDVGPRSVGLLVDTVVDIRALPEGGEYEHLDVRALVAGVIRIAEEE